MLIAVERLNSLLPAPHVTRFAADPSSTNPVHSLRHSRILSLRSVLLKNLRIHRRRASSDSTRKYEERTERIDSKLALGAANCSAQGLSARE